MFFAAPLSFAFASGSAYVQSISPGTNVGVGTNVTFTIYAPSFVNPSYSVNDSFSGGSVGNSDINSSGNFSWTPSSSDIGTHTINVTVTDATGNSATANAVIVVGQAPTVSIFSGNLGSLLRVGQQVSFSVNASNFINPTFSVSDSAASGTTVTGSDINSSGFFAWTPTSQDIGNHTITVNVSDSQGHSGSVSGTIIIHPSLTSGSVSLNNINPGNTVAVGSRLSFNATTTGFTNPYFRIYDSFKGSSVSSVNIDAFGNFSWTPVSSDIGSHTIDIVAADGTGDLRISFLMSLFPVKQQLLQQLHHLSPQSLP